MHAKVLDLRIQRLSGELMGFLRARCDHPEEVMQEVWFKVARANPTVDGDAAFRAYVYAVARRLLVDQHRRRQARIALVPVGDVPLDSFGASRSERGPHDALHAEHMLVHIESVLRTMEPAMAEVFRWRMTRTWSFRQIAEEQGVPLNTALSRYHRAVKRLANSLAERGLWKEYDNEL